MSAPEPSGQKRGRGRPKIDKSKSQVIAKLVEATETLLKQYTHNELSERKIATAAGINEAMIHYYFGGKDGLLFEVMLRYYEDVGNKLRALDDIDTSSPTVTRDIFKVLINAYYEKHWVSRMVIAEFARGESAFKDLYMQKFGTHGVGLAKLRPAIERLMQCNVYDKTINPDFIALSIFSMITGPFITGPFMLKPLGGGAGLPTDFHNHESWLNYVADLFDRKLRVAH